MIRAPHIYELVTETYALFLYDNINMETIYSKPHPMHMAIGSLGIHNNPRLCLPEIEKFKETLTYNNSQDYYSQFTNGYEDRCFPPVISASHRLISQNTTIISWKEQIPPVNTILEGYVLHYMESPTKNASHNSAAHYCFK